MCSDDFERLLESQLDYQHRKVSVDEVENRFRSTLAEVLKLDRTDPQLVRAVHEAWQREISPMVQSHKIGIAYLEHYPVATTDTAPAPA